MRARLPDIVTVAADMTGLTVEMIMGRDRRSKVTDVRHACWLLAWESGRSYISIGKAFGRDHSTIIYGCSRAVMAGHADPDRAAFLNDLREQSSAYTKMMGERIKALAEQRIVITLRPKPVPAPPPPVLTPRSVKPKNDFRAEFGADASHRAADALAQGSNALLAAIRAAQSNTEKAA